MVATKSLFLKPHCAESLCATDSDSDIDENENKDNFNQGKVFKSNDNIGENKSNITKDIKEDANSNADLGGWSFIQSLTNISKTPSNEPKEEKERPYVHPVYNRSTSQLSNKSLALCTETLGSETGSDIGDEIDISSAYSSDSESNKSPTKERSRLLRHTWGNKKVNYGSLPPPLTSISGSNCFSIKPRREGGRLVMKAVVVPSLNTCFLAERRNGRLKLHYVKNSVSPYSSDSDQEQEVENEGIEEDYLNEEVDGNNANAEMGKIQRPSRCKEGGRSNKGLLNWEPFWVATS
ncbi:hypothetical protein IFM89_025110 [Coptis chinensis]|uniref:FAF domain-containing protein n=1 Tax=Coptis chinensis TaxID=261450 RepID=A0A835HVE8_9MAGN|nr:hypothetical protein IFM89_025110 [Coptis chinensis]